MRLAVFGILLVVAAAGTARADDPEELGTYERAALAKALKKLELELDQDPEGKTLREIHVVNLPVLGEDFGFLQVFNVLHWTTRKYVIEREVLLRPGETWDAEVAEETERKLKDPLFTALAVVAPVKAPDPERQVDLLVVTRDIWSLRLNSSFEFQNGVLTELTLAPSENNVFGLRKQAALVFAMDQGSYSFGPQYIDKNIAGTRMQLLGAASVIFSRSDGNFEGSRSTVTLSYPLWSLDRKWGASLTFSHFDSRVRLFRGRGLRTYDNPETFEVERIPWQYDYRSVSMESSVVRQLGEEVKHRVTAGHDFDVRRPSLVDGFPDGGILNPTRARVERAREAFSRDVLPRSERSSAAFLRYRLFTPRYAIYRDLNAFDLAEDFLLGPSVELKAAWALEAIGSEKNFGLLSAGASWTFDLFSDGFWRLSSGVSARVQGGDFIDRDFSGTVTFASPRVGDLFRVVGRSNLAMRGDEEGNRFFTLGGESGLRGYPIAALSSDPSAPLQVRTISNLELRSMPTRVLFAEVGGLLFWDAGDAADGFDDLSIRQDVGVGLRLLVPQTQPYVFRFDYAIPLTGRTAGWPGRLSAGVQQVF